MQSLKKRKSAGLDNIPAELVQAGGEDNHHSHNNLQQILAERRMANPVDPVLGQHTFKERQPAAVPELLNDQLHKPPKQSHAEDYAEYIEAASGENHC